MNNAQLLLEQSPRQRTNAPPRYWILTKHNLLQVRGLTIPLPSGEEALAAFSFKEEAELFLLFGQEVSEGWQIRESSAGEIISLLMGPHLDVTHVALDPVPEMLAQRTGGLVSLDRKRFIELVLDRSN